MLDSLPLTARRLMAVIALIAVAVLGIFAFAPPAHAATTQGHAGTGTFEVDWIMDEETDWKGSFKESLITVDDEWVFCADVNTKFSGGVDVEGVDMVDGGHYSQDCVTSIAYALNKVWGEEYFAPGGERVTDDYDKYAVSNAFVWLILSKYGYQLYQGEHAYQWFSIVGLSEKGTDNGCNFSTILDEALSKSVLQTYKGYGTFYDCHGHQNLVGEFSLETVEGKARIVKASSSKATDASADHKSLRATFKVKGPIGEEGETTRTITTNKSGTFTVSNLAPGTYRVWETEAPANYKLGEHSSESSAIEKKVSAKKTATFTFKDAPLFSVKLQKKSSHAKISKDSDSHSLAGALYGIFASKDDADDAKTAALAGASVSKFKSKTVEGAWYETNASGTFTTPIVFDPDQTYYLVEVKASPGFGVDKKAHKIAFDDSNVVVSAESEEPTHIRFEVAKASDNPSLTKSNGMYSLAGAVYGIFADKATAKAADEAASAGDFDSFKAQTVEGAWYTTDANGKFATGESFLAGTTYYLVEMAASAGFKRTQGAQKISGEDKATETVTVGETPRYGQLEMMVGKIDAETTEEMKDGQTPWPQGGAHLAGARYTVSYYDGMYEPGSLPTQPKRTWVLETDDDGYARYESSYKIQGPDLFADADGRPCLPLGTVTVLETKAPDGYLLDNGAGQAPDLHVIHIAEDDGAATGAVRTAATDEWWTDFNSPDLPFPLDKDTVERGDLNLHKADSQRASGKAQGNASLSGAVYEIVNDSDRPVMSPQYGSYVDPGSVVCTIVTNEDGYASTAQADTNGWATPDGWHGALAFGSYTVREQSEGASAGYLVNGEWSQAFSITEDKQAVEARTVEHVQRGGIAVGKIDRGNHTYNQEGASTLEGAVFAIVNESAEPVKLPDDSGDMTEYAPGDTVMLIETERVEDDGVEMGYRYVAQTPERTLPFGSYRIVEVETSDEGYLFDDGSRSWEQRFSVDYDGQWVDLTGEDDACPNQVIRGDLGFRKVKGGEMTPLPNTPFKVTSQTTGEWHIIVTDANGRASTASEWAEHGHKTNGNDAAFDAESGTVDEKKLDAACGTWFDGTWNADAGKPWAEAAIQEDQGALPYDTYTVEELPCAANEGLKLISFTQTVYRDGYDEDMGSIDDETDSGPEIATTLVNNDGERLCPADEECILVDQVSYYRLKKGQTYGMDGTLHLVDEEGNVGDAIAEGSCSFEARAESGRVEITFEFDASQLGGQKVVAFERLLDENGEVIAEHADPQDDFQTLRIPSIETELVDADTGSHFAVATQTGALRLVDTVTYAGLVPNKTYTMTGTLHDRDTGETVVADGRDVTAQALFTPKEPSGTVDVVFEFSGVELGKTYVAFEEVLYKGRRYAVHADIEDEAQSAFVPAIGTTAVDAATGTHAGSYSEDGALRITDTVSYENLEPGVSHTLEGELHYRDADGNDAGPVMDGDSGEAVRAVREFTPEEPAGSTEITFEARADLPKDCDIVVFETLTRQVTRTVTDDEGNETQQAEDVVVASHADIADEGQTVRFPSIGTNAVDGATGTHVGAPAGTVRIVDTVSYRNVVVGQELEVSGTLHVRNADGSDGGALLDSDGNEVTAHASFTPEEENGQIELAFTLDAGLVGGQTVVAFERLSAGGHVIAVHEDIVDDGQSVTYPRDIRTTAVSHRTGTHQLESLEDAIIVDTVSFEGLSPNETYIMEATLHVRDGEGGDAGAYERDGEALVVQERFTPEAASGELHMAIPVDARDLAGRQVVVFERLLAADGEDAGAELAVHADIDDEGQTLSVAKVATQATDAQSGEHTGEATTSASLVDVVAYEGLVSGETYTLTGAVMDKESRAQVGEAASIDFTADAPAGTASLSFDVDDTLIGGRSLVVFETLADANGNPVAAHRDLDDAAQTVSYELPALHTTALDKQTRSHEGVESEATAIVDKVEFSHLVPSATYRIETRVMDKASGSEVTDGPVSSEFAPSSENGAVEVEVGLSNAEVAGKSVVVFERLYDEAGNLVGIHEDIEDEAQTVSYAAPSLSTTALGTQSASHKAVAGEESGIVDSVSYTGLTAGKTYTVTGTLMDKETGKPFKIGGKTVKARRTFTAEGKDGSVEVAFDLAGADLAGKSLVVFERIEDEDGTLVAKHEDIDNASQTVTFVEPSPATYMEQTFDRTIGKAAGQTFGKTGNAIARFWWVFALAIGLVGAGVAYRARRRKPESRDLAQIPRNTGDSE